MKYGSPLAVQERGSVHRKGRCTLKSGEPAVRCLESSSLKSNPRTFFLKKEHCRAIRCAHEKSRSENRDRRAPDVCTVFRVLSPSLSLSLPPLPLSSSRSSNVFPLASYVFFCERSRKKPSLQESAIQLPKGLSRTRLRRLISTRRTLSDKNRQLSRRPSKRLPDLLYALRIRSHG